MYHHLKYLQLMCEYDNIVAKLDIAHLNLSISTDYQQTFEEHF